MLEQDMVVDKQQKGPENLENLALGKNRDTFETSGKETVLRYRRGMAFYFSHEVAC